MLILSIILFIIALIVFYGFYSVYQQCYPVFEQYYGRKGALLKLKWTLIILIIDFIVILSILYYWIFIY